MITKERCDCGGTAYVCEECGSRMVTPMDNPSQRKPNDIVGTGGEGTFEYTNVCWGCGAEETVTITIQRE